MILVCGAGILACVDANDWLPTSEKVFEAYSLPEMSHRSETSCILTPKKFMKPSPRCTKFFIVNQEE